MSLTIKSLLLSMVVLFIAGCNTMECAGRDMQDAGEAVEREAAD
ncbi:MAG TPA: entericidin A/B family lipoprotein [Halomonas sp.]|nr:entericidin A/B family lipoprotein [Halomonas sp.]